MNNKIDNPFLKQLISEIANKATEGRVSGLSWETLTESNSKKLKKEAAAPAAPAAAPAAPAAAPAAPADNPDADANSAEEAAADAEARLQKAKADEKKAEEEANKLRKKSFISLNSPAGTRYILDKLVHYVKISGTGVDTLAQDMKDDLNVDSPEKFETFFEEIDPDVTTNLDIKNLFDKIKELANKNPEETPSDTKADAGAEAAPAPTDAEPLKL